jgi:hypothetical protein
LHAEYFLISLYFKVIFHGIPFRDVVNSVDGAFSVVFSHSFTWEAALRDAGRGKKFIPLTTKTVLFVCPNDNNVGIDFTGYS